MGFIKKLVVKMLGKKVDGALEKHGISKTKVIAIIGGLVMAYNQIGPSFAWPPIPKEVLDFLGAAGLWSLRDGMIASKPAAPPPQG